MRTHSNTTNYYVLIKKVGFRMLEKIKSNEFTSFHHFFDPSEGRMGVVVTFIAILELLRLKTIDFVQHQPFAPIYVKSVAQNKEEVAA